MFLSRMAQLPKMHECSTQGLLELKKRGIDGGKKAGPKALA